MVRTLPWLMKSGAEPPPKRRRPSPQNPSEEHGTQEPDGNARLDLREARNPSSSPPPSPPREEFMRPGFEADDRWRMVEDEFLTTARVYTRHLHQAEYQRQKKLARSKHSDAMETIARPVNGQTSMSSASRIKIAARKQQSRATAAVAKLHQPADSDDEEEDDPWLRDPRLAGLMTHKQSSAPLGKIAGVKSKTRAAHGFSQSQTSPAKPIKFQARQPSPTENDVQSELSGSDTLKLDDESDDLDAPSYFEEQQTSSDPLPDKRGTQHIRIAESSVAAQVRQKHRQSNLLSASPSPDQCVADDVRSQRWQGPILKRSLRVRKAGDVEVKQEIRAEEIPTFLV